MIDRVDLVIPGGHVKTLTSASRLIKEYEFNRREFYREERAARGDEILSKKVEDLTEKEKVTR